MDARRIDPKVIATLKARAALAGVTLIPFETDDGRKAFVATRWFLTKQLDSVEQVEAFLRQIGAPAV